MGGIWRKARAQGRESSASCFFLISAGNRANPPPFASVTPRKVLFFQTIVLKI
jgi:hypothetical protein